MLFEHNVSIDSPLRLHLDKGYGLLSAIQDTNNLSIREIILPAFSDYLEKPHYWTKFIPNVKNLNYLIFKDKIDLGTTLKAVWPVVASLVCELYRTGEVAIPQSFPRWKSIETEAFNYMQSLKSFHCEKCSKYLLAICSAEEVDVGQGLLSWVHGDLHAGNIVFDGDRYYIVDLENLHPAPIFSDLILFAILTPGAEADLKSQLALVSNKLSVNPNLSSSLFHALKIATLQHRAADEGLKQFLECRIHNIIERFECLF